MYEAPVRHLQKSQILLKIVIFVSSLKRFSLLLLGTAAAQWLRCCATNRKVAGSIQDGVTRMFH